MEQTVMQTMRADLESAASAGDPAMVRAIIGDVARAAIGRYSPRLSIREAYGTKGGGLSARWLSGSPEHETNDCSVRALANVSALTYEQAHALIADKCGRVNRKGPTGRKYAELLDTLAPRVASFIIDSWKPRAQRQTLAGFVAAHPRGVFLIWITGHALALIDGQIIDSHVSKPRARLEAAWKFGD